MPLFCPNSKANVHHILHNDFLTGSSKLYSVDFFEELHRCRLSDAGRQPAVQCICRESPPRIPVCQQVEVLMAGAAELPFFVQDVCHAGFQLLHPMPIQIPDGKLELLLVIVPRAAFVPVQQQFIKLGKQPDHSRNAFIGILLDGGVAPGLAFLEQESVSVDLGNTDRHRIGASVPHPFHVKVAAVGKIVPGRLSADPALVEQEVINHRPHRLPLRKSPRRQSPRLPERSVRCATSR